MKVTIVLEGGLGKQVAFSAVIDKLAKKYKEPIQLYTPYVGVFANNKNVRMAFESTTLPLRHPDIMSSDRILYPEPYKSNWQFGRQHIIQSYCELLDVTYSTTMRPRLYTDELREPVIEMLAELGVAPEDKFIVTQFFGGQTTQGFNPQQQYMAGGAGARNYHPYLAQALVNIFRDKYPDYKILNWGLTNEPQLTNVIPLHCDYRPLHEVLKLSNGFIGTDSSMRHIAKAAGKTGVVIYGETSFVSFGYKDDTNINAFCIDNWNPTIDTNDPRTVLVDPQTVVKCFAKHAEQ